MDFVVVMARCASHVGDSIWPVWDGLHCYANNPLAYRSSLHLVVGAELQGQESLVDATWRTGSTHYIVSEKQRKW